MVDPDRYPDWNEPGHYGAADTGVLMAQATIARACNIHGDAASAAFGDAVRSEFGVALPIAPNTVERNGAATALWLGPGKWLLVAGASPSGGAWDAARDALNAAGGALFDVSASRIAWTLRGPRAEAVLAKSCPLDLHPRAFAPMTCAQSVLGHVNALFVRDADAFTVMVARSFARDVWRGLCASASQYGYGVVAPAPYC